MRDRFIGKIGTDVYGVSADEARIAYIHLTVEQAAADSLDKVCAATDASAEAETIITADLKNPPYPRNLSVTPTGTTANVAAGKVKIYGTNFANQDISEEFEFTATASTTVSGNLAFKTVTKIVIPEQGGAGVKFKVGYGKKVGLPFMLDYKPLFFWLRDGAAEDTTPTLTVDDNEVEKNTIYPLLPLNGKVVDIYLFL